MHVLLILGLPHSTCHLLKQVPLVQPACPQDVPPFSAACAQDLLTLSRITSSFPVATLLSYTLLVAPLLPYLCSLSLDCWQPATLSALVCVTAGH